MKEEQITVQTLAFGSPERVREALYALSAQNDVPAMDQTTVTRLLRHQDSEIRERALFVFGIKGHRSDLCEEFTRVLLSEGQENWDVIGAALSAMHQSGCCKMTPEIERRLLDLLDTPEAAHLGHLIYAWFLRAKNLIDDDRYLHETLRSDPWDARRALELREIAKGART